MSAGFAFLFSLGLFTLGGLIHIPIHIGYVFAFFIREVKKAVFFATFRHSALHATSLM